MKAVEGREILGCFLKSARSLKAAAMDCTYQQEGGPSYSSCRYAVHTYTGTPPQNSRIVDLWKWE